MSSPTPPPFKGEAPPEAWEPLFRLGRLAQRPLERFLGIQAASGILLLACAGIAIGLANSAWAHGFHALWQTTVGIRLGSFRFDRSLEWVVNDGLMVIFFFVVGLEIRREIHHGELSTWRRAALPCAAALGGMLAPAGLYLAIAGGPTTQHGWGVPMATDIAFAVGVLALLGPRVPPALRVLLLALAVIDDLGAIVVIALFYSSSFALVGLLVGASGIIAILLMQRLGVRAKLAYVAPALVCWAGVYGAGIHPTIAGVIVGVMTPVRAWLGPERFAQGVHRELEALPSQESSSDLARSLQSIDVARREAISPAESLIEKCHPWVAYAIMPLFALANAGVALGGSSSAEGQSLVAIGVAVGLVLGKPLGVLAAVVLTTRLGLAELPRGIAFRELLLLGLVAGIGFTMALFVAQLAFADAGLLQAAKQGILLASFAAGLCAFAVGRWLLPERCDPTAAATADQAERSDHL